MTVVIDEALEILHDTGPEYSGGLANHGPMAAEALLALGRDADVIPWVEGYRRRLLDHPQSRNPITRDGWREALGDGKRVGDWIAFFDREIAASGWRPALNRWVAELAPGIIAAATHGVIRTGHAARSLSAGETPARLHELAEGLGYWAARYQRLPETPATAHGGLAPSEAVRRLQPLPPSDEPMGLIVQGLARLHDDAAFPDAINLVDVEADASAVLSDLTAAFARVYLANCGDLLHTITFIHAVTGPSAVRLIMPHLEPGVAKHALRYGWQAAAGLYAAFGSTPDGGPLPQVPSDTADLIDRAVATGDEHAIKFAEACLREHALNPDAAYLAAAADAVERLGGG